MKQLKSENKDDFVYLNAMKAPVERIKNHYRYQILARFYNKNNSKIIDNIYNINNNIQAKNVTIFVEVNPQSLR